MPDLGQVMVVGRYVTNVPLDMGLALVQDLNRALMIDEQIFGFYIAMDHITTVRIRQASGGLLAGNNITIRFLKEE